MNNEAVNKAVALYLESKAKAWSPASLKSESARLKALAVHIDGNPETLWQALSHLKPYSKATAFTRVSAFWEWAMAPKRGLLPSPNPYSAYREENPQLFRNVYTRKLPSLTFEQAMARIALLDAGDRAKAEQLLKGGLRWTESFTLKDGEVVGKGGKTRRVFTSEADYRASYSTFRRKLAAVGLKPHTLRKICATQMARSGQLQSQDMCKAFGWASFNTAQSYLAPLQDEALASAFKAVQGGTQNETKPLPRKI